MADSYLEVRKSVLIGWHAALQRCLPGNEPQNEDYEDELPEDGSSSDMQESDRSDSNKSSEQDEEMDLDD